MEVGNSLPPESIVLFMIQLQSLFNKLNDSPWTWWPLMPPARHTPMSLAFYANCLLYRSILPWILCMTALLGGLYMPGFLLTHTFAGTLNTALIWAGFWIILFGFLYLPHFFFWNRRAWNLRRQHEAESPFQPMQTTENSTFFNLQGKPLFTHHVWTHTLTAKEKLHFPTLLGYTSLATFYITGLTLLLAPALLSAVAQDMQAAYPSLSLKPATFSEAASDYHAWDGGKHRVCCLGGPLAKDILTASATPAPSPKADSQPRENYLPGNYMLEVPWQLVDVHELNDFVSVCSRQGQCVFFQKRKADTPRWIQVHRLHEESGDKADHSPDHPKDLLALKYRTPYPGEDIPFQELDAIMKSQPGMLKPQTSLWKAVPLFNRLVHKLYLVDNKTRIYRFQTAFVDGYQLGDPAHDRWVSVLAFDSNHQGFSVNFGRENATSKELSQETIYRILKTLQPKGPTDDRNYAVMATKRLQSAKVKVP